MENEPIDINESLIKDFVEHLRPKDEEIRKKLDIGYSFDGQTVLLFEIRPSWHNPKEIMHSEFAKIRYYKSKQEWKIYWKRANGNWDPYNTPSPISHLEQALELIDEDEYGCFFG